MNFMQRFPYLRHLGAFLALCLGSGCTMGRLQTRAYTWRSKVFKNEKPKQDWYTPPKSPKKWAIFREKYGWCTDQKVVPYLESLKKLMRSCIEISIQWRDIGVNHRAAYGSMIALGLLGGIAVLSATVFNFVKIEGATVDPGLVMTVSGAALTGISSLMLTVTDAGGKSNRAFTKGSNFLRLIQNAELEWQSSVCHAPSQKLAIINATKILSTMSKQCVRTAPKVNVNPNIAKAVQDQQKNVKNIIARYQVIQSHVKAQQELNASKQRLEVLVKKVEDTHEKILRAKAPSVRMLKSLKSLCARATSEHKRVQWFLQQAAGKQKRPEGQLSAGSWAGICKDIPSGEGAQEKAALRSSLQDSQKQLQGFIKPIRKFHKALLLATKEKTQKRLRKALNSLCVQAIQENKRSNSIRARLRSKSSKAGEIVPGAWFGICRYYVTSKDTKE